MPGKKASQEALRIEEILNRLRELYPTAECALLHKNAFELLVATILSAQCTDERVNKVTPGLFARYPDAPSMAQAEQSDLEEIIKSTGFFRNKSKNLLAAAKKLVRSYGGKIPETIEDLVKLPGVARKTANVVLGTWFGIPSGVVVDTHVSRISGRLDLTFHRDAKRIEKDLMEKLPQEEWINFSHRIIHHGRQVCKARKPRCEECALADLCPASMPANALTS